MRVGDVAVQREHVLEHKATRGTCDSILGFAVRPFFVDPDLAQAFELFAATFCGGNDAISILSSYGISHACEALLWTYKLPRNASTGVPRAGATNAHAAADKPGFGQRIRIARMNSPRATDAYWRRVRRGHTGTL